MIWKQRLARSLHLSRSKPDSRYLQLATYCEALGVQNRTIVFRGFNDADTQLYFVTEKDCDKVRSLQSQPQAEIAWYFAKTREQYRLRVECQLVGDDADINDAQCRQQIWQELSVSARESFKPANDRPPTNFIVSVCTITQVDYLYLGQSHERYLYQPCTSWQEQSIPV
jgi:hypothetical protein